MNIPLMTKNLAATPAVSGVSWFGRQWQKQPLGPPRGKWTWMDLNRSSGWQISLWDATDPDGKSDAWATVIGESGKRRCRRPGSIHRGRLRLLIEPAIRLPAADPMASKSACATCSLR